MSEQYGKYELIKRLATGGMAQIYLARDRGPDGTERLRVVKRILPHLAENDEFIKMFLHEARIAARLNHPNIVRIDDLGQQDDSYFIAMEFIHGEDLRRIWKRAEQQEKELPIGFVLRTIADAAAGLDYAHKKVDPEVGPLNIVHRDISPQNILVSFEGQVKVVDFGIAKAADAEMNTRSGVLKGKYSYMSPEQASGRRDLDQRSDLFALGVVLYELLTGTRLFKRANDIQTLNAVMECAVVPPSAVNARIPADLDPLVMKALAKFPEDRYRDARALQVAIEEWLASHPCGSSNAHVAQFMRELYADRLAAEARSGLPVPEDAPDSRSEEEISPRRRTKAHSTSRTAQPVAARERSAWSAAASRDAASPSAPPEVTRAIRPEREKSPPKVPSRPVRPLTASVSGAPPPLTELPPDSNPRAQATEVSRTTPESRRRPIRAVVGLLAAVLAAAAGVWFARSQLAPQAMATVRVQTEPAGATLTFNGRTVEGTTPLVLPQVPGGTYPLLVGKENFRDKALRVTIPASGELTLPTIVLEPLGEEPAADAGTAVVAEPVALTVDTEPTGAQIFVDGQPRGLSPVIVRVPAGAQVRVRAELAGYSVLEKKIRVGSDPQARETLVLERKKPQGRRDTGQVSTARDSEDRVGTVRFVITPIGTWAEVACGSFHLGTAPFEDKQLPAGTYECTFTNPELGTKREKAEVRPGEFSKVIVKFN